MPKTCSSLRMVANIFPKVGVTIHNTDDIEKTTGHEVLITSCISTLITDIIDFMVKFNLV